MPRVDRRLHQLRKADLVHLDATSVANNNCHNRLSVAPTLRFPEVVVIPVQVVDLAVVGVRVLGAKPQGSC